MAHWHMRGKNETRFCWGIDIETSPSLTKKGLLRRFNKEFMFEIIQPL